MKKLFSLLLTLAIVISTFAPAADAISSNSPLPNLYSKSVASQLKAGTYKYKGVKLGISYGQAVKAWGKPDTKRMTPGKYSSNGSFFYGSATGTYFSGSRAGYHTSPSKLKVNSYNVVNQSGSKYNYSKVIKTFGKPTRVYGSGTMKSVYYGNFLVITFRNGNAIGISQKNYSIR